MINSQAAVNFEGFDVNDIKYCGSYLFDASDNKGKDSQSERDYIMFCKAKIEEKEELLSNTTILDSKKRTKTTTTTTRKTIRNSLS